MLTRELDVTVVLLLLDEASRADSFAQAILGAPVRERFVVEIIFWPAPLASSIAKDQLVQSGFVPRDASTALARDSLRARSGPELQHVRCKIFAGFDDATDIAEHHLVTYSPFQLMQALPTT